MSDDDDDESNTVINVLGIFMTETENQTKQWRK